MGDYDGLTVEEIMLLEFGNSSDQIRYAASIIEPSNPMISNRTSVYKAAGTCLKRYGFRPLAISVRHLDCLTDDSVFPRLSYACKSYSEAFAAKESGRRVDEEVSEIISTRDEIAGVSKLRKSLANPKSALLELFCDGKVSPDEYEKAKDSNEASAELVRKVMGNGI